MSRADPAPAEARAEREKLTAGMPLPEPIMSALKALQKAAYKHGWIKSGDGDAPDSAAEFRHAKDVISAALARAPAAGADHVLVPRKVIQDVLDQTRAGWSTTVARSEISGEALSALLEARDAAAPAAAPAGDELRGLRRALKILRHPNAGMEPPDGGDPSQADRVRNVAEEIEELIAAQAAARPDPAPPAGLAEVERLIRRRFGALADAHGDMADQIDDACDGVLADVRSLLAPAAGVDALVDEAAKVGRSAAAISDDDPDVEIVARALCIAEGLDPDFDYDPNGVAGAPGSDIRWRLKVPAAKHTIAALRRDPGAGVPEEPFQARNAAWMAEVFAGDPTDLAERVNRFGEEALELQQSLGQTAAEAHALVDYVHGRPIGKPAQEVGGTMTTLALLCEFARIDMAAAGEAELARCSTPEIRAKIREKRSKRHGRGPLPGTYAPDFDPAGRSRIETEGSPGRAGGEGA